MMVKEMREAGVRVDDIGYWTDCIVERDGTKCHAFLSAGMQVNWVLYS